MAKNLLTLIFLSIFLVSCGGKKGSKDETSASFKIFVGAISVTDLTGGIMVYGRSSAGENIAINITTASISLSIPNGSWDFYAFGWNGTDPMTGALRCGETSATLGGGNAAVSFNLSDANCDNGNYGSPSFKVVIQFKPLRLTHCTDTSGVIDGTSDCNGFLSITKSYQVSLFSFGNGITKSSLTSKCIDDLSNVGGDTTTTLNIPTGGFFAEFLV